MSQKLNPNSPAPALQLPLVGGGTFDLAQQTPEHFTMLVFYRGAHCPVCMRYLRKLESLHDAYRKAGFCVVAVSMDDIAKAERTVQEAGLHSLPVAYDMTIQQARSWGLWLSQSFKDGEPDIFSEPGFFWVRADGSLYLMDISNMPWGARPDLDEMLTKAPFAIEKGYPARGTYLPNDA